MVNMGHPYSESSLVHVLIGNRLVYVYKNVYEVTIVNLHMYMLWTYETNCVCMIIDVEIPHTGHASTEGDEAKGLQNMPGSATCIDMSLWPLQTLRYLL